MLPVVNAADQHSVAEQFRALAEEWKSATALLSSSTALAAHPAYRAIIALGPSAMPLMLRELEQEPVHWFEALQAISGEDPVPPEHWGNIPAMAADWLAWGRQQGLI